MTQNAAETVILTPAARRRILDRLAASGGTHLSPPEAYAAAADIAASGLNVVIIETQSSEEASWSDFVCRHAPRAAKTLATPNAVKLTGRGKAAGEGARRAAI